MRPSVVGIRIFVEPYEVNSIRIEMSYRKSLQRIILRAISQNDEVGVANLFQDLPHMGEGPVKALLRVQPAYEKDHFLTLSNTDPLQINRWNALPRDGTVRDHGHPRFITKVGKEIAFHLIGNAEHTRASL